MTNLEAALSYHERGWSVFPLRGKLPTVEWKPYQKERPTREQIIAWWTVSPTAGIGCALGRVSNVVRLDADGSGALERLVALGGIPATAEFVTGQGGRGWLLKYLDGEKTQVIWKGKGEHEELRLQSDGAYTVLPPSDHPLGGKYEWISDTAPANPPQWLRDRYVEAVLHDLVKELRPTVRQPERSEIAEALQHIDPDEYDTWVQVGMALKSAGEDYLSIWVEWSKSSAKFEEGSCERKWNTFSCAPGGLTTRSILYWAEQKGGWKPPNRHEPLTDLGNARILARVGDGKILHTEKWGWLVWDGRRWARDGAVKAVQEMQKQALEHRLNRAVESLSRHLKSDSDAEDYDDRRKRKLKTIAAIRKLEDESRIRGSRALAESEPALSADYRVFDVKPWVFNAANCTVDLRTLEVHDHDPADRLSQICPTPFDPEADCSLWLRFLEDVLPDAQVRQFLQAFFGACLSGDIALQMMPVLWGGGSNGKSTLVTTVMHVLGEDYAMKAKRDLLMQKRGSEHPTSLARLFGKRFVACVESSEDGKLDETLVKELTGGDAIAARRMREDEWEFRPTHKCVLVTNHKPEVKGTDDAIWRRLPLVPFTVQFPEGDSRRDPMLPEKLQLEAPGILRWMVDGCQRWLQGGKKLERPDAVRAASDAYRGEQDRLGAFIADRCAIGPDRRCRTDRLMEAYTAWSFVNRQPAMNSTQFGRALSERGFQLESKGSKFRLGIDLRTDT